MTDTTETENIEAPTGTEPDATPTEAAAAEQPVEDVGALFKAEVAARAAARDGTAPKRTEPDHATAATEDAGKTATEAPVKGADTAAPTDAKPDPWAGVDPALKRQYDSMVNANRSLAGRVSSQERLLNELRAAQGQGPKPAKTLSPEALTKVREDYPELSSLVDLVEDTRQTLQAQATTVGTIADERHQQQAQAQIAHLATRHSDWSQIYQSPEFAAWKAANPAFGTIADTSENGEELAQVFDVYKLQAGLLNPNPAPGPTASAPTKPDAGAKRAAQLETSLAVSGKAPAAPTGSGGGPDATSALWRQEMARRAAQRSARA